MDKPSTQKVFPQIDATTCKLADTSYISVVSWESWLTSVGVSDQTGRRWRERGYIQPTVNINGRLYVTTEDIERFVCRARRGEFFRAPKTPVRPQDGRPTSPFVS